MDPKKSAEDFSPPAGATVYDYKTMIRESHLDSFGHVNNAQYLLIFEEARWDFITRQGYGLKEVQKYRIGPTLLEVNVRFRREIVNRESIIVRSWISDVRGKIMRMRQVMIKADGEVGCVADFVIGLFDLNSRKLIEMTPEWRKGMGLPPAST